MERRRIVMSMGGEKYHRLELMSRACGFRKPQKFLRFFLDTILSRVDDNCDDVDTDFVRGMFDELSGGVSVGDSDIWREMRIIRR